MLPSHTKQKHGGVDVVVPFYNEASILADLCHQFISQINDEKQPLPTNAWRVIAVNNASTDHSVSVLKSFIGRPGMPDLIIIDEPRKGVVQARKTGSEYALRVMEHYPYLLHIDADNELPTNLITDVCNRLSQGHTEVLSYAGHFSHDFWQRVPRLAQRYFDEVGVLDFCDTTRQYFGFKSENALFSEQLFNDFVRVPNQLGLAMTKDSFKNCGGYFQEYDNVGNEILGEARNIWFRLDIKGARLNYVNAPFITLNPRRLLGDPERWCSGRSYEGGMIDIRNTEHSDTHALLNQLAENVDFSSIRRNLAKRFIIETCIADRSRITNNPDYFIGIQSGFKMQLENWLKNNTLQNYADTLPLVMRLTDQYAEPIIDNMRVMRGLD